MENELNDAPSTYEQKDKEEQKKIVDDLFNKLIGKKGFNPESSFLIQEDGIPENILLLLKIFSSEEPEMQLTILHHLICLLIKSSRNLYFCQDLNVFGVLVDILPSITNDKIFEKSLLLLEIVGKFSTSVRNIKVYMSLLSDPNTAPDRKMLLIETLQNLSLIHI
eukprot:TRINITY_DN4132_c0_g2_i1.p1 TRINITY_DN4132_c0_g2~~TRINITY_DN4132_c0_g2_i1.p1  ORF type:complete len:165 (+),score=36.63 TRINITY_DN4132_c0_g2_i1:161-655(+)